MKGKLVVIEGLDGAGKQTQTQMLSEFLLQNNIDTTLLSFPDYSSPSSSVIKMYLNSELGSHPTDINAYAAASFYAIDRFVSFKKSWENIYNSKKFILCDRYTTSNTFYQMCKLPESKWDEYLKWLFDFEYKKLELPMPDAVIYLDVPVEISQKLMEKRYSGDKSKRDLHESNINFLQKCEKASHYVIQKNKWHRINCIENKKIKTKEIIHKEIVQLIKKLKLI